MITEKMISDAGGNWKGLKQELIDSIDALFHAFLGRAEIHIVQNGLNSGNHDGKYHPLGMAVDFYLSFTGKEVPLFEIIALMIFSGFRGIGVYWNGKIISFHGDVRDEFAQWKAVKGPDGKWIYTALINDPRSGK
jgi:hypothetical protein